MLTIENAAAEATRFIETIPPYPGTYSGRGVVICAGGPRYLTCAWVAIKMLRHVGCQLPIEVWYLGDDEGDPDWIRLVEPLGVTCVDALKVAEDHPHPRLGGWESKAFAILHSRFREVVFLDADNIPVVDPTFLFDASEYRDTGAIFWPDGFHTPPDSTRWQVFGISYRDESEQESGQILVNKELCWTALNLSNWYNQKSDFFYNYIYGDKDTFRLAWHKVGLRYSMPTRNPEIIPFTMCQHGFSGERLFQHRVHDKWSLVGNRRVPDFWHEDTCREFINDLRHSWDPMIWQLRRLPATDRKRSEQLVGLRFELEHVGFTRWAIELGPRGYLACGQSPYLCFWWCEEGQLVLAGIDGQPVCRFTAASSSAWVGVAARQPREQYRLAAI